MLIRRVLLTTPLLLLAAGCGDTQGSSPVPSAAASQGASLPDGLELQRSGGFAGFKDRLTVGTDGTVVLTRRGGVATRCVLEPALRERVAAVPWSDVHPAGAEPGSADRFVFVIGIAGRQVTIHERNDLDAVQTAALETAGLLFSAATSPRAGGGCRPA